MGCEHYINLCPPAVEKLAAILSGATFMSLIVLPFAAQTSEGKIPRGFSATRTIVAER